MESVSYSNFHDYLRELVSSFRSRGDLRGIGMLAKKHHCVSLSKEQFYEFNLNTVVDVTRSFSDEIRNRLRKESKKSDGVADIEGSYYDILCSRYNVRELPSVHGSPFMYALCASCAIDDMGDDGDVYSHAYELISEDCSPNSLLSYAVRSQLDAVMSCGSDGLRRLYLINVPTLCYNESGEYYHIAFAKVNNNGSSFWLCSQKEPLLLLAELCRKVGVA